MYVSCLHALFSSLELALRLPSLSFSCRTKVQYESRWGGTIVDLPVTGKNDKAGKPVGIYEHIGRRPILAFGNSDSDMQMIEYTMAGKGRRLGLFVHHTDAEREYAYDRDSHVGTLDKALDLAKANDWIVVDMKNDWGTVFPE